MDHQRRVSGKQLTTMVIAVCAAVVLAPVGVYAAAHSTVSIVDAKHPTRGATVTTKGAQLVTGSLSVSGTPTVAARPAAAATPFYAEISMVPNNPDVTATVPAGKKLVVTALSAETDEGAGAGVPLAGVQVAHAGTAFRFTFPVTYVYTTGGFDFYTGMVSTNLTLNTGDKISAYGNLVSGAPGVSVSVSGYLTS